ncbi:hypothetical protein K402DRAFT_238387 [Aulographum hederae CBS 113979]|uniref:Uncharacterized protein n=1 Tax=Aulographum hederae CBS 113979 TaxID=1176131 RepID=A0A6G1GK86_9PEZI|nr:hypothetical protein K402DRAFT_238387 [Aulographum hederae CBS 113979]
MSSCWTREKRQNINRGRLWWVEQVGVGCSAGHSLQQKRDLGQSNKFSNCKARSDVKRLRTCVSHRSMHGQYIQRRGSACAVLTGHIVTHLPGSVAQSANTQSETRLKSVWNRAGRCYPERRNTGSATRDMKGKQAGRGRGREGKLVRGTIRQTAPHHRHHHHQDST